MNNKKFTVFNIIVAVISLTVQYNGIYKFNIFGFTPMLFIGFLIPVCMFISELPSFFLGLAVGFTIDSVSLSAFGFNALILPLICLVTTLTVKYLFNNNISSCAVLSFVFSFIYFSLRFIAFYRNIRIADTLSHLFKVAVPCAILTAVFSAIIYLFEKRLTNRDHASR